MAKKEPKINVRKRSLIAEPFSTGSATTMRDLCRECGLCNSKAGWLYPVVPEAWSGKLLVVYNYPNRPGRELLVKALKKAGFSFTDVAWICPIRSYKSDNPSMHNLRCCRPFFLHAITKLSPKFIIAAGSTALRVVANKGDGNITKNRGKHLSIPGYEGNSVAYCTFDPMSVIEGGFHLEGRIIQDINRIGSTTLSAPGHGVRTGMYRGFDTEFTPTGEILTIGIATTKQADAKEVTEKDFKKKVRQWIRATKIIAGHNIPGDIDQLVHLGLAKETWLEGKDIKDSLLLARMVDENRGKGSYGLEALMLSEFNYVAWKAETEKIFKKEKDARAWTPEQRRERCRIDAWATRLLAEYFENKLKGERK